MAGTISFIPPMALEKRVNGYSVFILQVAADIFLLQPAHGDVGVYIIVVRTKEHKIHINKNKKPCSVNYETGF